MNVLLTSVGRRTYLVNYFKDAVADINGKVFAANSIETYALKQADEFTLTPGIYSDNYIDYLINYCLEKKINIIISLFDIDLPILSRNKQRFSDIGINIIISSPDIIDICNDKWATYLYLKNNNIKTPITYLSRKEATLDIEHNKITFPLIIKPRWGMGSIGIYKVDNVDELDIFYNKVKRDILNSYLKYESAIDIDNAILIQEFIDGEEYGIEIINDLEGNYITTFSKKKLAMRSGETDLAKTISDSKLESIGEGIALRLKHISILDTDCLEKDGQYYVLEMNARFGGQYPFSHLAGANLPKQIIEWSLGENTNKSNLQVKPNVLCGKEITPVIIKE